MFAVTKDINVPVNGALDETQVRNKINVSYDMTYFGKITRKTIISCRLTYLQISLSIYGFTNLGKYFKLSF